MMTKQQVFLLDDNEANSNWIKTVKGKDGKTAREREVAMLDKLITEFEAAEEQATDNE